MPRAAPAPLPPGEGEARAGAGPSSRAGDAAALTAAIARGDRAAFAGFYEAWFDRCYAMARRTTGGDESSCLDVVQEAMLRVVRHMKPLPDAPALEAWMARAVRSAAADLLRRDLRRLRRERARPGAGAADPRDAAAAGEASDRLRAALARLPGEDAAALGLRLARGRTLDSTGAGLGTSGDAAHGRVRRALAALRHILKGEDHD